MEINIWASLWNEEDGHFRLRQQIPDVCVFKGCQIDGWYHSNASGCLVRRRQHVTLDAVVECFTGAATCSRDDPGGEDAADAGAPVAILRRRSTHVAGGDKASPLEVPDATLLTRPEFLELVQRVQDGVPEADVWSVQTIIRPCDGARHVSVYTCDSNGRERSDIFARGFQMLYPTDGAIHLPSKEDMASEKALDVPPARRAAIEAKTLGVVRFAKRFHSLDFEGLVLEFVFDGGDGPVLHACWCTSLFAPGCRRRPKDPVPAPRAWVCEGGDRAPGEAAPPGAQGRAHAPDAPRHGRPLAKAADPRPREPPHPAPRARRALLLEVWRGEEFLGEALLPSEHCAVQAEAQVRELCLGARGGGPRTRPDARKGRAAGPPPAVEPVVALSTKWLNHEGHLQLNLLYAEGLPSRQEAALCAEAPGAAPPGPRVSLWQGGSLDQQQDDEFTLLWTSQEAHAGEWPAGCVCPRMEWTENVALVLDTPQAAARAASGPRRASEQAGGPPRSSTHWGVSDRDGAMHAHVLAEQVRQRLNCGRQNKATMLTRLAGQLEQYHGLYSSWDACCEEFEGTRAKLKQVQEARDEDLSRLRQSVSSAAEAFDERLARACRELHESIDKHRLGEHNSGAGIVESRERDAAQRAELQRLKDKNRELQASLDKTVRKFEEVSATYSSMQEEVMAHQAQRVDGGDPQDLELVAVVGKGEQLGMEIDLEGRSFACLKAREKELEGVLSLERKHASKLEEFVQRLAMAPAARTRKGGGFVLDCSLKNEAAMLLMELGLH